MKYQYLFYSLFFLIVLVVILVWRRDLIKDAIPAFLFGSVAGPISELLYVSDYWRPPSVLSFDKVRIEDVIFGVAIFGLAFTLYPTLAGKKISPVASGQERHLRTIGTLLVGAACMAILIGLLGVNSVFATAISFVVMWLLVCVLRRDLLLSGLITGLLFIVIALFVYGVFLNALVSQRELQSLWLLHGSKLGVTVLGKVPLSELIWFFGVGSFLSIFELFVNKRHYVPAIDAGDRRTSK